MADKHRSSNERGTSSKSTSLSTQALKTTPSKAAPSSTPTSTTPVRRSYDSQRIAAQRAREALSSNVNPKTAIVIVASLLLLVGLIGGVWWALRSWNRESIRSEVVGAIERLKGTGVLDMEGETKRDAPKLSVKQVREILQIEPSDQSAPTPSSYVELYSWRTQAGEEFMLQLRYKKNKEGVFMLDKAKAVGAIFRKTVAPF